MLHLDACNKIGFSLIHTNRHIYNNNCYSVIINCISKCFNVLAKLLHFIYDSNWPLITYPSTRVTFPVIWTLVRRGNSHDSNPYTLHTYMIGTPRGASSDLDRSPGLCNYSGQAARSNTTVLLGEYRLLFIKENGVYRTDASGHGLNVVEMSIIASRLLIG